ncbi:hypothetical protein [Sorangium sp. So ce128]|uniref:hypothetical protein n=1 Tax=Sorangium sp. So ce128 TaxID=3133281 RepID=UPI003F5D9E02
MQGEDRAGGTGGSAVGKPPDADWPDGLARAVADAVTGFLNARGIARDEDAAMTAALATVSVAIDIALQSGVPRCRLLGMTIQLLALRTGAELVTMPLPRGSGSGREKPS